MDVNGEDWAAIARWTRAVTAAISALLPSLPHVGEDYLFKNALKVGVKSIFGSREGGGRKADPRVGQERAVLVVPRSEGRGGGMTSQAKRVLTREGDEKRTVHYALRWNPSLRFAPGDALGVFAPNDVGLVDALIAALGATGDEPFATPPNFHPPPRTPHDVAWTVLKAKVNRLRTGSAQSP